VRWQRVRDVQTREMRWKHERTRSGATLIGNGYERRVVSCFSLVLVSRQQWQLARINKASTPRPSFYFGRAVDDWTIDRVRAFRLDGDDADGCEKVE
jgi:hypothetical protein